MISSFYIDPGTGSMLFTLLIGLISAGVYGLRNLLVKARFIFSGGRADKDANEGQEYVIFSEGKRYWCVFEDICDEFERRNIALSYLTASPDDPALEKPYEFVKCKFIGEGNRAFAHLNMIKADVVLATTPGLDVYQWKRSRDVKWYAHTLHALSDASMYRMFGLDYYDAVLLSGGFQVEQIREMERLRNLPAKETEIVGLTYVDRLKARLEAAGPLPTHEPTVLLAPSWGASAIFSLYGGKIIDALLKTGYHIVVRPHPQSFDSEKELMDKLMAQYPASDQLEWNQDSDNFEVLRRSDIMISDFSGVIFDYALVFDRPIIYTEPAYDNAPYDACWLEEEPWTFSTLPKIGKQLSLNDLDNIKALIDECLASEEFQQARDRAREECWQHQGEAALRITDYLIAKHAELMAGDEQPAEETAETPAA